MCKLRRLSKTSSSAVAEKPRCRLGRFWPKCEVVSLSEFFWVFCLINLEWFVKVQWQQWLHGGVNGGTCCSYNGGCLYAPNLHSIVRPLPTICARLEGPVNALQLCCWQFSHKETSQQTFFEKVDFQTRMGRFALLTPFRGLEAGTMFILGSLETVSYTHLTLPTIYSV